MFLFVEWGNPVVSSDKEAVDSYLIGYVGKYYLYSPIADGYENFIMDDDEFLELLSSYDKVVILEEHYTFNVMTKKLFNHTYPIGVYSVEEILVNNKKIQPVQNLYRLNLFIINSQSFHQTLL
ncbi:hypothetical protein G8B28_13210 [Enterococcus faecium]|uniref:hypothetical protein n=1 Tax=Enterococcus faecium TaxID=1352 RepID=UPI001883228E|nr:hypothetical protein [Enterococcus faecium]MBE9860126.1 hypothetical protein [Enterococcus faecium]